MAESGRYHTISWDPDIEEYECIVAGCRFHVTKEEVSKAGYEPRMVGLLYVAEADFGREI